MGRIGAPCRVCLRRPSLNKRPGCVHSLRASSPSCYQPSERDRRILRPRDDPQGAVARGGGRRTYSRRETMTADTDSPGVVARRLFLALADERWLDAVALVDPAVVRRHFEWWVQHLSGQKGQAEVDVSSFAGEPPNREEARQSRPRTVRLTTKRGGVSPGSGEPIGVESLADLERLTPAEVMARAASFRHAEWVRRVSARSAATDADSPPAVLLERRSSCTCDQRRVAGDPGTTHDPQAGPLAQHRARARRSPRPACRNRPGSTASTRHTAGDSTTRSRRGR